MEISTTFTILLPADEAYRFLLDLEQVAPCVPGGELGPAAADGTYPANVTVRLGPMRLGYSGLLWISEQDDSNRRAVLRAKANETGAQGSLEAAMTMNVTPNGDGPRVDGHTELALARSAAKLGRGVGDDGARRRVVEVVAGLDRRRRGRRGGGEGQGEAVLGLEAAARAVVRPGTPVLNLVSGIFGKGMSYWLRDFGADVHELEVSYNDAVDAAEVERFLESHPEIEVVAVVHSETPSGTLNPVAEIGPIAKAHGALTLVDCVSSVGGIPFKADEWQLDVCVAGPQKCLGGPPGMSLMSVSEEAWTRIRQNPAAPRASSLSLLDWTAQWLDGGWFP